MLSIATYVAFNHTMNRRAPVRFAYEGSDPTDCRKIVAIGHSRVDTSKIYIQKVATIEEYEYGCKEHEEGCRGHICETPSGMLLPPQHMALRTNIMKNEIYAAAQHAFASPTRYHMSEYKRILTEMLQGKDGKMRSGVLTSPVDGSLRMAVIPHTFENAEDIYSCPVSGIKVPSWKAIFIPHYLSDKFKIVRVDKQTSRYVGEYLRNGDAALCIREPALDSGSVTLVRVFYWNKTALGVHPTLIKALRGDYDGDELHVFPLYSEESIQCVDSWTVTPHPDFVKASAVYARYFYPDRHSGSMGFMWHTNFSFKELLNGKDPPLMSGFNRMKPEHIDMLRKRSDPRETARTLIETSIEGLNSINIQQHSQPIVGDMSRIARLALASIKQLDDGSFYVVNNNAIIPLIRSSMDKESGNSAVRAISRICATGQQAMLQAHKITKNATPSHDMIRDMVSGSEYTVVLLKHAASVSSMFDFDSTEDVRWHPNIGKFKCLLCRPEVIDYRFIPYIHGAYNPMVLSVLPEERRYGVCKRGIEMVFKQYNVPISTTELDALSVAYTYMVTSKKFRSSVPSPITSRDGIASRKLHWFEVTVATSYYQLQMMLERDDTMLTPVNTISSAVAVCNFDFLE